MAERYSRLFTLPEDLYTSGSPLVIAAGALLMDNQSGQVLAQLKLRSITDKTISAVRLLVIGSDSEGSERCREEYEYAGLSAARDSMFGAKQPIRLSDASVRGFSVQLLSVSFSDGSVYTGENAKWRSLPVQADLNQRLFDTELIRQYKLETSNLSRFVPVETQDLWLCACGEINRRGESCHRCEQSFEQCKKCLNVDMLRENKSLRLNGEAVQAALDEAKRQSRAQVFRRILYVLLPMLLIAGIALGVYKFSARRAVIYEEAQRLYRIGEYADAAVRFDKLRNFRDAAEMAAKAKKADAQIASYERAGKLLQNERWDDAYEAYLELGDYEDSAELAKEARYQKGLSLLREENYTEAREIFVALGQYKDAATVADHFFNRLLSEEVSLNLECNGPLTTSYRYDSLGRISEKTEHFSAYDGMSDRVYTYSYDADGSYSVTEGQVEKHYDPFGAYIGQGDLVSYTHEYEFYDDGSVHFRMDYDAKTKAYRSSAAYDEHGNLIGIQNEDGTTYTLLNEYSGDQLTKQERYNEEGTMVSRVSFEYDGDGLLKRATFLTPGATATVTTLYTNGPIFAVKLEK